MLEVWAKNNEGDLKTRVKGKSLNLDFYKWALHYANYSQKGPLEHPGSKISLCTVITIHIVLHTTINIIINQYN